MWNKGHMVKSEETDLGIKHIPTNDKTYMATTHQKWFCPHY